MKVPFLICIIVAILMSACSTTNKRYKKYPQLFNSYTPAEQHLIKKGQIAVGFDERQVRMALGSPSRIREDYRTKGATYIWEYYKTELKYNNINSIGQSIIKGSNPAIAATNKTSKETLTTRVFFETNSKEVSSFQTFP